MNAILTNRNFRLVEHQTYPESKIERLIQESSAIGDYKDALNNPGSSFLWIGKDFHLNREEVEKLKDYLTYWLIHKRLF